jgi:hypothetical protein
MTRESERRPRNGVREGVEGIGDAVLTAGQQVPVAVEDDSDGGVPRPPGNLEDNGFAHARTTVCQPGLRGARALRCLARLRARHVAARSDRDV